MRTSIAGENAYEVDSGICARVRDLSGLLFGQNSISGAERASRLAAGGAMSVGYIAAERALARPIHSSLESAHAVQNSIKGAKSCR